MGYSTAGPTKIYIPSDDQFWTTKDATVVEGATGIVENGIDSNIGEWDVIRMT